MKTFEAQREALARAFSRALREQLTADQLATVQRRNQHELHSGCHSHDYCDANQVMLDAFEATFGRELNLLTDDSAVPLNTDTALVAAAWAQAQARASGFAVEPAPRSAGLYPMAKRCARCGEVRGDHAGMERFCPGRRYGQKFSTKGGAR